MFILGCILGGVTGLLIGYLASPIYPPSKLISKILGRTDE